MSEYISFIIAISSGGITFIYLFIVKFLRQKTRGNKLKEKAEKEGAIVQAEAVKNIHRRHSGPDGRYRSETVTYKYLINGKTYTKNLEFRNIGVYVGYPDIIDIYYDKKNPRRTYSGPELDSARQHQVGFYMAIIIPIIVIIFVFNILKLL